MGEIKKLQELLECSKAIGTLIFAIKFLVILEVQFQDKVAMAYEVRTP